MNCPYQYISSHYNIYANFHINTSLNFQKYLKYIKQNRNPGMSFKWDSRALCRQVYRGTRVDVPIYKLNFHLKL